MECMYRLLLPARVHYRLDELFLINGFQLNKSKILVVERAPKYFIDNKSTTLFNIVM